MINRKRYVIIIIAVLVLISATTLAGGYYENISVLFDDIKIEIEGKEVKMDTKPFIYEDRVYVPIRFVAEAMGGEVVEWNNESRKAKINTYVDFPENDYLGGETFVYGIITRIDYDKKTIKIEQHYDDNSVEVTPILEVRKDAVIVLQRNDKKMNIDFKDLKCSDDVGMIIDKDNKVRGIIITL